MMRITCLLVLFLTAASALAQEKVRMQLNWLPEPEFGGIYAARENGSYKNHHLDVDILPGGPGAPIWQQVDQGRAEYGVVSADEVLIADSKGADLVAIFTI
jgi:NitT/TauT family transport system substrate-binding protein